MQRYVPGISTDVLPHDVDDRGPNQRILYDEGVEVWGGILHDRAHDVYSSAAGGHPRRRVHQLGRVEREEGLRMDVVQVLGAVEQRDGILRNCKKTTLDDDGKLRRDVRSYRWARCRPGY